MHSVRACPVESCQHGSTSCLEMCVTGLSTSLSQLRCNKLESDFNHGHFKVFLSFIDMSFFFF